MTPDLQIQLPLCCPCGSPDLYRRGLCEPCYNRGRRSRARFGGGRERVLARDRHLCRVCHAPDPLVVHHRSLRRKKSNRPSALITLCRACHARLHRLRAIDRWVPELLTELWAEQHPGAPITGRWGSSSPSTRPTPPERVLQGLCWGATVRT